MSSLSFSTTATSLRHSLRQQVVSLGLGLPNRDTFEQVALAVFRYQATFNPVYRTYLHYLNCRTEQVTQLHQIPFLPISFFKTHTILTGVESDVRSNTAEALTFASSGTTGEQTSRHYVLDQDLYNIVSTAIFEQTYGPLRDFHILALLPSYLERNNSSLVYMVQQFMQQSAGFQSGKAADTESGFFLHNYDELTERLQSLSQQDKATKILLIGVTFGLLDWAESMPDLAFLKSLPNLVVMETGGMKGRRKELLREEVHAILTERLGVSKIHSEYGMTELLSQAYSTGDGVFQPSATLRVFLRDINDPFCWLPTPNDQPARGGSTGSRQTGGISVVDLANLDSCSFIETQDLGQYVGENGDFRVMGRFDNSDVRGCNLLVIN